jgi:hypothetical protein
MPKKCTGCKETKELDDFGVRTASKDGRNPRCRLCARRQNKEHTSKWLANNTEQRKATIAAYNQSVAKLGANRKWRFGLAPEDIEALIQAQGGVCGLCKQDFSKEETFVDHDHACCPGRTQKTCGKCVRTILCRRCNQGLGYFFDDPELLRAAADYIERHRRSRLVE